MNTGTVSQTYIKVITTGSGSQRISLPSGFTRKPAVAQEKELFEIFRKHFSENGYEGKSRIRSYRFYFSDHDYIDYSADEVRAGE